MKHGLKQRKLNRTSSHRLALLKNLSISLIKHETITTTTEKAKELRPFVEKLVTLGKKGDLAARKKSISILQDEKMSKKLFSKKDLELHKKIREYQKMALSRNTSGVKMFQGNDNVV